MKADLTEIILFLANSQILTSKQKQKLAIQIANYLMIKGVK